MTKGKTVESTRSLHTDVKTLVLDYNEVETKPNCKRTAIPTPR
ncbi:hypothetical protein PPTG_20706 [Phytophthora nicotianae INRA-310]|uniref:Uncharacterized protein n=1 Tax=Phytophthora nicotianae (strain INRA-310) TaxID=761204 RepID=W2REZ7_PHYN3|nr:hypothetical protein PPTG_20706 [Phytophthora nicotianae INRA-310]ETN23791.1 hypothetical protein PPTG_20706 [Phytophthora nicotianae INRA-310]